jgi:hypothetical protein
VTGSLSPSCPKARRGEPRAARRAIQRPTEGR